MKHKCVGCMRCVQEYPHIMTDWDKDKKDYLLCEVLLLPNCPSCGSIEQRDGACRVCSFDNVLRELSTATAPHTTKDHDGRSNRRHYRRFSTATKIIASIVIVLVAISTVGAGLYLSARPSGPACSNRAVNYPSCNNCGSQQTYSPSTNSCFCTNNTVNPPSCNRFCANNAINPPTGGNPRGCDQCADGRTVDYTGTCPPQASEATLTPTYNSGSYATFSAT